MAGDEYLIKIQLQVQNDRALQLLTKDMERVAKQQPKIERGFKKTQIAARASGRGLQNFSYQMQDIIVQTSGGVDVMRSLSQQLPQMFINMGALGAALGVVLAGLPLLIQAFSDTDDVAVKLTDALDTLESATADLGRLDESIDLTTWIDRWNESTVAIRNSMLALMEFQVLVAESRLNEAGASLEAEIAGEKTVSTWDKVAAVGGLAAERFAFLKAGVVLYRGVVDGLSESLDFLATATDAANRPMDRMMELYSLNEKQMTFFNDVAREGASITMEQVEGLEAWATAINNSDPDFVRRIEQLRQLALNGEKLADAQAKLEEARGGGLLSGGTDDKEGKAAEVVEYGPGLKEYNDELQRRNELQAAYYPEAVKLNTEILRHVEALQRGVITQAQYNEEVAASAAAYEQAIASVEDVEEQFSLLDFGIETFGKSFDTMLNGVLMGTQSISDGFRDMSKVVIAQVLKVMAQMAIAKALTGAGYGELAARISPSAKGNIVDNGSITPFAKGGIVSSPTVFPLKNGIGLMGESGAEVIAPLRRNSRGEMGVGASPVNVTVNNNAPGVDVRARQGENGLTIDVVMKQLASAIGQGGNDLSNAFEGAYSLGRGRAVY